MERTDDDSWDLAASVGATATMVAAGRARATKDGLIEDHFAEPLVRAVGIEFFSLWAAGELTSADVDIPDAVWGMRQMTDVQVARTRYIDSFLADATSAGICQVVLLASGLDTRGYRLPWPPAVTVFEIDQPQVIEFKTTTLAALGAEPTSELRSVAIDLRHDWPSALRRAGFDAKQPVAWVAEGLLAYLPPDAQDHLLDTITALSATGSRLIAESFWSSAETKQALAPAHQKWYQHGLDVSIDDLAYTGQRNDVAAYLEGRGWSSTRTSLDQLLANNSLPVLRRADGQASITDHYYCVAVAGS